MLSLWLGVVFGFDFGLSEVRFRFGFALGSGLG